MLASLISDHWKEGNSDDNEAIFIDRNGRLFEYVLDYLRASEVYLPTTVSRNAVEKEFEFYGIDADMNKVIEKYGFEYYHSLKEKADAFDAEMRAIRISAAAECEFWKSSAGRPPVRVSISDQDFVVLKGRPKFGSRTIARQRIEALLRFQLWDILFLHHPCY